ncbi:MAG TPA: hypothetical protein VFY92_09425 [Hyphomicrobiaceae bacterium]|nr:hypothetical protein [Hyphomicrobiaceae bacterium]
MSSKPAQALLAGLEEDAVATYDDPTMLPAHALFALRRARDVQTSMLGPLTLAKKMLPPALRTIGVVS